ncbi:MAG: hypothetical protein SFW67_34715 [Myxococcaceae bacterium]|nr:hypothetical protein [Myxococcaceae bacterium]
MATVKRTPPAPTSRKPPAPKSASKPTAAVKQRPTSAKPATPTRGPSTRFTESLTKKLDQQTRASVGPSAKAEQRLAQRVDAKVKASLAVGAPRRSSFTSSTSALRGQLEATRRLMDTGVQLPRGPADSRGAEFRTVPTHHQESVARVVRRELEAKLEAYSPHVARELAPLVRDVGSPSFYRTMGRFDRDHRGAWLEMAQVQRSFADAEPGYDGRTRAYSESMRLTLHATAVLHRATSTGNQYETFIRNHVTAFRENGGSFGNLRIGLSGSAEVLRNTPLRMMQQAPTLAGAAFDEDPFTQVAAELVRQARAPYAADGEE